MRGLDGRRGHGAILIPWDVASMTELSWRWREIDKHRLLRPGLEMCFLELRRGSRHEKGMKVECNEGTLGGGPCVRTTRPSGSNDYDGLKLCFLRLDGVCGKDHFGEKVIFICLEGSIL